MRILQRNGVNDVLAKYINFVEQRLKFSHVEGSIIPEAVYTGLFTLKIIQRSFSLRVNLLLTLIL